ncbi:hypothetical protein ATANTOWER_019286 [Ataeniobius toweri]|uniref:Uncharacterized protein n=1 Tax=Ataeniobius toweri TaxID=208326 RepID=A0ABU7BGI2_9TELE|nr:hypothetical protein [Ataeniobius toweri]
MLKRRVNHDSPTTSRDLRYSGRISSTPEALPPRSFLTTLVTPAWVMKESGPKSPASVSTRECMMAGLRRSSKYSFHRPIMSPVEVNSLPPPLWWSHWGIASRLSFGLGHRPGSKLICFTCVPLRCNAITVMPFTRAPAVACRSSPGSCLSISLPSGEFGSVSNPTSVSGTFWDVSGSATFLLRSHSLVPFLTRNPRSGSWILIGGYRCAYSNRIVIYILASGGIGMVIGVLITLTLTYKSIKPKQPRPQDGGGGGEGEYGAFKDGGDEREPFLVTRNHAGGENRRLSGQPAETEMENERTSKSVEIIREIDIFLIKRLFKKNNLTAVMFPEEFR